MGDGLNSSRRDREAAALTPSRYIPLRHGSAPKEFHKAAPREHPGENLVRHARRAGSSIDVISRTTYFHWREEAALRNPRLCCAAPIGCDVRPHERALAAVQPPGNSGKL